MAIVTNLQKESWDIVKISPIDGTVVAERVDEYEGLITQAEQAYTPPTQEELDRALVIQKVQEYKAYLLATDFKMTVDYYATLSEVEQLELTTKRQEAREYIRMNEVA